MAEEKRAKHNVIMADRVNLKVTGVLDVISFDEEMIVSETEMGIMILKGINLHVNRLNLENGELEIDGDIYNLMYEDKDHYGKPAKGIFGKIFK